MSITVTYSTIDHRYFMRRTKSEIIRRIGELRGQPITIGEHSNMMTMTKDELASEAMRLVRALPPPPDPADTLVQVIHAELHRQSEEPHGTQYVSAGLLSDAVMLDGTFDLRQLAQAILKSGIITP